MDARASLERQRDGHYADDLAALVEKLDLKGAFHVGYSTGGGEVARYIGRHGATRVAKAVLVGAVSPLSTVHKTWTIPQPCRGDGAVPDVHKYEILVLGSGEAGKYLAWTMAKEGRATALVDRRWLGGSCSNIACLPSKNLIYSARVASLARRGA
jgi:pimeloyl-ACP methyl ester carboxylesterase